MNKQPEITDATRNKIYDAFWECYHTLPVEKITVNAVSQKAGIHRSSFYRYFPDVYKVMENFHANLIAEILSQSRQLRTESDFTLPSYMTSLSDILIKYADQIYRCLEERNFRDQFINVFRPEIEQSLNIDPDYPNAEYLSFFLISTMITNFTYWYENRDRYSLYDITAMGQKLFLNGIIPFLK